MSQETLIIVAIVAITVAILGICGAIIAAKRSIMYSIMEILDSDVDVKVNVEVKRKK